MITVDCLNHFKPCIEQLFWSNQRTRYAVEHFNLIFMQIDPGLWINVYERTPFQTWSEVFNDLKGKTDETKLNSKITIFI